MPYEKYIGDSPCGLYGIGWGIDHWECHGMAFWVMHWVSMDLHWGAAHWEFHGSARWVSHWDAHMGVPWHCIGKLLHRSTLEDALWAIHWGFTMWLLWDWMWIAQWGSPWNGTMCNALGIHGLAVGLLIGNSMEILLWVSHWDAHMELPWNCMGIAP